MFFKNNFNYGVNISYKTSISYKPISYKANLYDTSIKISEYYRNMYSEFINTLITYIKNIRSPNFDGKYFFSTEIDTYIKVIASNQGFNTALESIGINITYFENVVNLIKTTALLISENQNLSNNLKECKEKVEILNNIDKLHEYLEQLKSQLIIFNDVDINMTIAPKIKQEYIIYIQNYGIPQDGVYDVTLLKKCMN